MPKSNSPPPSEWRSESDLLELTRRLLYTPVVGDILDQCGRFRQFLPQPVRPLVDSMKVVGRAMPVLQMDVFGHQERPFGLLTRALDDLRLGEVYVAAGGTMQSANWGEIMTAAARSRGAVGAVIDGYHRDTPKVLAQNWPVFSRGAWARDSAPRMKVVDFRCRIEIGGVTVMPGDLIFGDLDGVVVIPRELEGEVVSRALEKAHAENVLRKEIEEGLSSTEAFERYGIL